jgi:hypothetical protein
MPIPAILEGPSRTRLMQGAVVGALATVIIGFGWGGWTLGSSAREATAKATTEALVAVLAPMCVEKFRSAPESVQNLAELKRISYWQQDAYIQKGGWATFAGLSSPDIAIAQACAQVLTKTP